MTADPRLQFLADMKTGILTVRRDFAAPRALVWDCYTKSELLDQWFAPKPLTARTKSMEFREGGHWHFAMIMPDGQEYWSRADYRTIDPGRGYTSLDSFTDETGVPNTDMPQAEWTVTFHDKGGQTMVETVVTYASPDDLQKVIDMGMKEGLTSTLERLDELLEKMA